MGANEFKKGEKFDFNGDKEAIIQFHLSNTFDDEKGEELLESLLITYKENRERKEFSKFIEENYSSIEFVASGQY